VDSFAIDSNVYIDALRNRDGLIRLKQFLNRAGSRVSFAGIVGMELRAGARTDDQRAAVDDLLRLYDQSGRVFGTSFEAHWQAGRVLASIAVAAKRGSGPPPGFVNDAVLAAACREHRVVLITSNAGDFTTIQRHLRGFRFIGPWPLI
jgi:predicted nucleic acid-binding protein